MMELFPLSHMERGFSIRRKGISDKQIGISDQTSKCGLFDLTLYNYRTDKTETLHFAPKSTISIHTEYDYRGKGQCVTLSTLDDTFFIYPMEDGFNATKIQFATEYMAKL